MSEQNIWKVSRWHYKGGLSLKRAEISVWRDSSLGAVGGGPSPLLKVHEVWRNDCQGSLGESQVSINDLFVFEIVRAGEGQRERETQNLKQAPGSELSA